jgi:hypothetical protein
MQEQTQFASAFLFIALGFQFTAVVRYLINVFGLVAVLNRYFLTAIISAAMSLGLTPLIRAT